MRTRWTVVLAAFALLPLSIPVIVSYLHSRQELLAGAKERLSTLATLKIARLRSLMEQDVRLAHQLARDFRQHKLGDLPPTERARPWGTWTRGVAVAPEGAQVVLIDLRGRVIASSRPASVDQNWTGAPALEAGRLRTQTAGPDQHPSGTDAARDTVYLPVRSGAGATVAELAVISDALALRRWAEEDVPAGVHLRLVRLDGERLIDWPPPVGVGVGVGEDDAERDDSDNREVLRLSRPVEPGGSEIELRIAEDDVLRSLLSLRRAGLGGMIALSVVALALAFLFGSTLSRPVLELARHAHEIGGGDLRPLPPTRRTDELGTLWTAMEQMRVELVGARDRLQTLLDDRTQSLHDREQLLGSLFEVLPDVVFVVDADRTIRTGNRTAEQMFGAELAGHACHQVLYARDAPCSDCPLDVVLAGEAVRSRELRGGHISDAVILDLVPLGEAGERADAAVYSGRIVTNERMLQLRLVHQERMAAIGALAAGVAHEIGNPLASLSSLAQLRLRRATEEGERAQMKLFLDHLERVRRAVVGLTHVAREPGAGVRPVLLQTLAERAVQLVSYDPRARGVNLVTRLDPATPAIRADEDQWLHALLNLLVNALDAVAGRAERSVEVVVEPASGGAALAVHDTGCGMTSEVVARATDPLFTTKAPGAGTGMGLFQVNRLANEMGAALAIDSAPGEGTEVRIILPISRAREKDAT